jgi:hypothetical protein
MVEDWLNISGPSSEVCSACSSQAGRCFVSFAIPQKGLGFTASTLPTSKIEAQIPYGDEGTQLG